MEPLSRRALLGATAGTAGVVAVAVAVAGVPADAAVSRRRGSAPLRSDYRHCVGRVFTATHGGRRVRLRLTAVRDLEPSSARQRERCFLLVFAPVGQAGHPDAIYALRRRGVRTHRLFLSSLGTDNALQAVVNRSA